MYVAVKGGEKAIAEAHKLLARERRGDASVPELSLEQSREQLCLSETRGTVEGSHFDTQHVPLCLREERRGENDED